MIADCQISDERIAAEEDAVASATIFGRSAIVVLESPYELG
jgi:hypothetical protein